jgi:hypothetical protein
MVDKRLTYINDAHVHAERLAREVGNVLHVIAVIEERHNPVEDGCPDTDPGHELRIQGDIILLDDIIYGIVEE